MPPSRFTTLVIVAAVSVTALFLLSSSTRDLASHAVYGAVDVPKAVKEKLYEFEVPKFRVPFYKSPHKPPVQVNSTDGESSWLSDWRWLNPFSSYVTWDQERVVLPHLTLRPYVYTYYDTSTKRDKKQKQADADLLLTWKRAWWAQGFKPVILTQAEAMNHPLYQSMRQKGMQKVLEFEFERWLAWAHMGTGLLASWHAVPMASYDDPLLSHLRRGQYEKLTRFEDLEAGLFVGEKTQINDVVAEALKDARLSTYKTITQAIPSEHFKVEKGDAIAHYDSSTIASKYSRLSDQMKSEPVKGQDSLNQLINAHLHTMWQNTFSDGIRVLKPLPAHTSKLVEPAQHLAQLLAECPKSILQSSCPPNRPKCSPCVGSKVRIETKSSFLNTSSMFTIGIVPHPYTMITLNSLSADVSIVHIRRETDRDPWIRQATKDILGNGRGGPSRVIGLKDVIASENTRSRGIWFTVEHFPPDFDAPPAKEKTPSNDPHPEKEKIAPFPEHWLEDVDWYFGFSIPRTAIAHGESYNPIPGQSSEIKGLPAEHKGSYEPNDPTYKEAMTEVELLRRSRETIQSKDEKINLMKGVAEAWNMADTEIWRFVKALRARSLIERRQWEDEEASYNGPGSSRGGRWF